MTVGEMVTKHWQPTMITEHMQECSARLTDPCNWNIPFMLLFAVTICLIILLLILIPFGEDDD